MALALVVTLEAPKLAARLDVSGITSGTMKTLTVNRSSPSGAVAGVRGAVGVVIASGQTTFLTRDYELPLDTTVTYTVTAYDAGGSSVGTASAIFRIDYAACEAWLVDIARPLNSLQLMIESMIELEYALPSGVHHVLDRRDPVVTALAAYTPESELVLLTDTLEQRESARALLGSGYPFLLRTIPEQGIGNMYLAASEFVEERILTLGTAPQRRWTISCLQVERPDPSIYVPLAPSTYAIVKTTYASYTALKAAVASYDALAYSYPTGVTNPILPWPPDDV
jgi:hypothetical protein